MPVFNGDFISVTAASEIAGVGETYIRRELKKHLDPETKWSAGGRVSGYQLHERLWLVSRIDAERLGREKTWRAGRPRDQKRPTTRRKRAS